MSASTGRPRPGADLSTARRAPRAPAAETPTPPNAAGRVGTDPLTSAGAALGPTLLRWYVAATFLGFHARHKLQELAAGDHGFADTVAALGFPAPLAFAWAAALTQGVGALCLLLGVATRPAAFALGTTMVFAVVEKWPLGFLALEPALTYVAVCAVLVLTGAGAYAVDRRLEPTALAWLARRRGRPAGGRARPTPAPAP